MESKKESQRLKVKGDYSSTFQQLIDAGLAKLKDSPHVVDAGSGIGFASNVMVDILKNRGLRPRLTLLDSSASRLKQASLYLGKPPGVSLRFEQCGLSRIPLQTGCADFVFCRFVFEYLADPPSAFNELVRILKPGGKLVVGDLDNNCLIHHPLPTRLEIQLQRIMSALRALKLFDPYAGRKIYSQFYRAALKDVKVRLYAHHLFYGPLLPSSDYNTCAKIDQLISLQRRGKLKRTLHLREFRRDFLKFLRSKDRFSYTPLIMVEGRR